MVAHFFAYNWQLTVIPTPPPPHCVKTKAACCRSCGYYVACCVSRVPEAGDVRACLPEQKAARLPPTLFDVTKVGMRLKRCDSVFQRLFAAAACVRPAGRVVCAPLCRATVPGRPRACLHGHFRSRKSGACCSSWRMFFSAGYFPTENGGERERSPGFPPFRFARSRPTAAVEKILERWHSGAPRPVNDKPA
jgi:hypothetical protein